MESSLVVSGAEAARFISQPLMVDAPSECKLPPSPVLTSWVCPDCGYLKSCWTRLNSGASAVRSHSNAAISLLEGSAPSCTSFCNPTW